MKRVVVTGMSAITALGDTWDEFKTALQNLHKIMRKISVKKSC